MFKKTQNKKLAIQAKNLQAKIDSFERTHSSYKDGLTQDQVVLREEKGLINKKKKNVTKSYGKIIYDNFFTFFNVLLYIFAILVICAGKYNQLLFMVVITANSLIGLIQDIRARKLVERLSIVNNMKVIVIRNGVEEEIFATSLVLDDVIYLRSGDQIPADCIILKGKCAVNEAMLTGEPDDIKKKQNDTIYSGTYVSSGTCYARVNNISILNKAEQIQSKASTFSKPKSEILRSLRFLFRFIGVIIIVIAGLSILAMWYARVYGSGLSFTWEFFITEAGGDAPVSRFVGSMVSMIPAGMFLLTSVTLSVGVITLSRKRCLVQEMYSIEMLARVDTLCLDKTGTITDGTMSVTDYVKLDRNFSEEKIEQIVSSLIAATKDDNYTAQALKKKYGETALFSAKNILPFSSETKSSAAYFDKLGTFAIGAFGYIKITNKEETEKIIKKYSSKGYRCLIVCHSKSKIEGDALPKTMSCVGVILLVDHIRDDAPEILKWFEENNVDIKVISGDDPVTVSEIAKKAGIKNSNLFISLEGLSCEQVKKIATKYSIFGRVSPDQKEALVVALKEAGKTVAMTGDGVNDILALKRADCSIAMASGSDAAKNISQLVLLDSNFSVLPSVVAEGRKVINNIQRTSSLFLTKTMTSILISLVSVIVMFATREIALQFPLSINNFYIWETAFIGVGGFFLALEPNSKKISGSFLTNALKKAIPAGLCISAIIFSFYVLYMIDHYNPTMPSLLTGGTYDSIIEGQAFKAACSVGMTFFGFVAFVKVCYPFSKYRAIVTSILTFLVIVVLFLAFNLDMPVEATRTDTFGGSYFGFEFSWMNIMTWLWTLVFTLVAIDIYFVVDKRIDKWKLFAKIEKRAKKAEEKRLGKR